MALRRQQLIKRFPLPAVRRTISEDTSGWDNSILNYNFTKFVCYNNTLQPLSKQEIEVLPDGITTDRVFTLFTNTNVFSQVDGYTKLSDSIYIPDEILGAGGSTDGTEGIGGWYTCINSKVYMSGIIEHCECIMVKDTTITDDDGNLQYPQPDIDAILPQINTKDKLRSEDWIPDWLI